MGDSTQSQASNAAAKPKPGFIEKRWNMLKAGVKSVGTYLTSPKTYMFAAVAAGIGLGIGALAPMSGGWLPATIGISTDVGIGGIATYAARMVVIGTMMHMGIDMFKEGHIKGMEDPAAPSTPAPNNQPSHASLHSPQVQQQQYNANDYRLQDGVHPLDTPVVPNNPSATNQPQL